jgi:hypothetical protein
MALLVEYLGAISYRYQQYTFLTSARPNALGWVRLAVFTVIFT